MNMQNGSKSVVEVPVKELLSQMTLEEKASLCSGQDFWHMKSIKRLDIPSLMMTDGPYGLRKQTGAGAHIGQGESVPATCFPSLVTLGSTWNRDLAHAVGHAIGEEARAEKVAVVLGPGANIKRSPLCGRNFEYFSEDPFLAGEMAKSHIQGLQSTGVGASLKHYVANNQEYRRMMINAVIDERALREIYLAGFEIAVKEAQPATVMCAYNQVNGVSCSEHYRLMTQILKEEWGHTGLVVTDWGAINRRVDGLLAGVELQMPGTGESSDRAIVAAIKAGEISESVLDYAVERLLTLILERTAVVAEDSVYDAAAHHALGHKVATEGAVLLKNTPAILPLTDKVSVAVIGELAKVPRFQGGGSANVNPIQVDNAWDEMVELMGPEHLSYAAGYDVKTDQVDPQLIAGACEVARTADVVVVFAGLTDIYECEGADRDHMQLPDNHNALIEAVAAVNPNIVVVLSNGSPVEMPWVDQVAAVLEGYLGGQAGGSATADILYGRANPSGKLAETFPVKLAQNPSYNYFPGGPRTVEYRESLYVGYRYYDTAQVQPLFPFGHGLSYTTFTYHDLKITKPGTGPEVTVSLTVTNTGTMKGKEVVQLYVRDVESTVFRPDKELKEFAKIELQPGESGTVSFNLGKRAFAFYDVTIADWRVEAGQFEILVGASSADIRLSGMVALAGDLSTNPISQDAVLSPYTMLSKDAGGALEIPQTAFERLCSHPMPENNALKRGEFTVTTPITDMQGTLASWFLNRVLQRHKEKSLQEAHNDITRLLLEHVFEDMPVKSLQMTGEVSFEIVEGLVEMANGRFFKGLWALLRGWWINR